MNGALLIHKPAGMTSFDVVAKLRKKLMITKIGHTGTLDPEASGLLIVLVGNATKLVPFMNYEDKEYIAEYRFGYSSDTYDIWGQLTQHPFELPLDPDRIKEAMSRFQGTIIQKPPVYSAIKVNGKKLYEYARKGEIVEVPEREVRIDEYELLSLENDTIRVRIVCSAGTYIRSLAHDLGEAVGIPAVMSSLVRTRIGSFALEEAYQLDELPPLEELVFHSPYELLSFYPYAEIDDPKPAIQGKKLLLNREEPLLMVTCRNSVIAAYEKGQDGWYSCKRGLL